MRYLKYVRIDERLIHGQVLIKWLEKHESKRVIIIDDAIMENPILISVMQRSLPKECNLDVYGCEDGARFLSQEVFQYIPMILVRTVSTIVCLEKEGILFEKINIARMPYSPGKEEICENVYMDHSEKELIQYYLKKGSSVYVQMVPDSEKVYLGRIIK